MPIDHTGETYANRRITGPGSWKQYRKRSFTKETVHYRERLYQWVCLNCGATGESRMAILKRGPHCCPQVKPAPDISEREQALLCSDQCEGCGHYRAISIGGHCCNYLFDVGHIRPKVDLRDHPCPVRDPDFVPPKVKAVTVIPNQDFLRRILNRK